ncbi:MAG TPA: GHMP kinase [Candidatus Hydrogenedentes bacterium]|nr:GHMP kinase [Candidatus Hydrogenedentota bacterium]HPG66000.1 GHMP kinase [Candidatus Hydrogenedentota bacterium]
MSDRQKSCRIINAVAPIRICDLGGWTDTWFAEKGAVLNIGVYPYAEAQIYVSERRSDSRGRITIHAENFGERYSIDSGFTEYDRHPLLEASIDIMELPENLSFEVNLYSAAPAGCSTGTSASVTVALLGALDLLTPGHRTPHEIASLAHRVETEKLGLQCGIQDQLCAAYGGICFIEMFHYPYASVSPLQIPNAIWWEFERRLLLVYLGRTHSSSDVHRQVIDRLDREDADKSSLEPLRAAAYAGKDAIYAGDFEGFGRQMITNTEAQAALHPALVSDAAREVIALAKAHGAIGWKVNGAGGEGGSLTILCGPEGERKRAFIQELPNANPAFRVIPTYLSRMGLRRWETER